MEYLLKMFEEETIARSSSSMLHDKAILVSKSEVFKGGSMVYRTEKIKRL